MSLPWAFEILSEKYQTIATTDKRVIHKDVLVKHIQTNNKTSEGNSLAMQTFPKQKEKKKHTHKNTNKKKSISIIFLKCLILMFTENRQVGI